MAKYLKTVEAEQYTGDLKAIKKFLKLKNAEYDDETRTLIIPEETAKPDGVKWTARVDDYIVKTDEGFIVYRPARFEKEFQLDASSKNNTLQVVEDTEEVDDTQKEDVVTEENKEETSE